ncbi:hypothetical protein [Thermomonas sp.]|uniref:hypothetical protein n=1 Tax=Thermomonas sp. TaxID=1971895 RepID=UPI002620FB50|nr:hypothetical protein [Thermomonas sp.]
MSEPLIVRSKSQTGFRRAGIAFTRNGITLDAAKLTPEILAAIRSEPALEIVSGGGAVDDGSAPDKPAKTAKAAKAGKAD